MPVILLVAALGFATVLVLARRRAVNSPRTPSPSPRIGSLEADRATLRALRDAGANLTLPTEVIFYLYFRTREAANLAAHQAETPQLAAEVQPARDNAWVCVLSGDLIPTETTIHETSVRLQSVAAANGGDYDGWEARVSA